MLVHKEKVPLYLLTLFTISIQANDIQFERLRGIALTKKLLYDHTKDFTCLDGSKTINFQYVNDDYCDCPDGSDEPGTSACPNGLFHCTNAGYRPKNIPSSRVNDGLCDCCDGSDEWKNQSLCPNTCIELWKIAKEEMRKQTDEANQGYVKRQAFSEAGLAVKAERQTAVAAEQDKLTQIKEEEALLQQAKDEVEARETQAKEERRKIMEEELARKAEAENIERGNKAFAEMDADGDARLTATELQAHTELDPDTSDGDFTEAEAEGILSTAAVAINQFMENVWPQINGTFQTSVPPPTEGQEAPTETVEETTDSEEEAFREEEIEKQAADDDDEGDEDDDYYEDEEDAEDNYEEEEDENDIKEDAAVAGEELYYDDATRAVIEEANEARKKFEENQKEKRKIEAEIQSLNKALALDFGPDEAFQALQFECFEMITMEYKYKLCPFDKTSQSPKNGGSETSLGRWGSWTGPEGFRYSKMKFENGLTCWNGPARSTEVRVRCGVEHKLLSVDEPSRCAYVFEFATPCACVQSQENLSSAVKDEL